jgi:hypothetical protein
VWSVSTIIWQDDYLVDLLPASAYGDAKPGLPNTGTRAGKSHWANSLLRDYSCRQNVCFILSSLIGLIRSGFLQTYWPA